MSAQVVRFLQQESARLQKENLVLQNQVKMLHSYIDVLAALHQTARQMVDAEKPLDRLSQPRGPYAIDRGRLDIIAF